MDKIGVDLGGTKIEAVLLRDGNIKPLERKRIATEQQKGYSSILKKIYDLVESVKQKKENTIGIGIPGFVCPIEGKIFNSNTQCLNGKNFRQDLEEMFHQKVIVENDANCLALSEACFGVAQDVDLVLGIILGTGMGSGIVWKKKIISGKRGYAGEVGHISSDIFAGKCWCGQKGCNELYLSGTGMQDEFTKKFGEKKLVQEIYQLYLDGEKKGKEFFEFFLHTFGRIMSNLVLGLQPQKIVIGGGVSNLPILYKEGVLYVQKYLPKDVKMPPLVSNSLGDSSGVFGAAALG